MSTEKFKWNSPEGEKRIQASAEARVAHDEWAREITTPPSGEITEGNFFDYVAPPVPEDYVASPTERDYVREVDIETIEAGFLRNSDGTELPRAVIGFMNSQEQ
jgi:hypothetical protein